MAQCRYFGISGDVVGLVTAVFGYHYFKLQATHFACLPVQFAHKGQTNVVVGGDEDRQLRFHSCAYCCYDGGFMETCLG